jgi:tetratricopeptide (TPR) repeat protein
LYLALGHYCLGLFDRAEEEFSRMLAEVPPASDLAFFAEVGRAAIRSYQRRLDEASALATRVVKEAKTQGQLTFCLLGRVVLIEVHLLKGTLDAAESEALALRAESAAPYQDMWCLAVLACVRLAQGRAGEALELAERAYALSQACGIGLADRHAMLLLVRAEARHALGDHDAARAAIRDAEEDLLRRAAKIPEPEVRRSFFENIPYHRRTLELAGRWLGKTAGAGGGGAGQLS